MIFNIKDFGAKGNGTDKDTAAIQKALDKCFSNGGGTVAVPTGTFLTGTLWIKDNTNLNLQPGAVRKKDGNNRKDSFLDTAYAGNSSGKRHRGFSRRRLRVCGIENIVTAKNKGENADTRNRKETKV